MDTLQDAPDPHKKPRKTRAKPKPKPSTGPQLRKTTTKMNADGSQSAVTQPIDFTRCRLEMQEEQKRAPKRKLEDVLNELDESYEAGTTFSALPSGRQARHDSATAGPSTIPTMGYYGTHENSPMFDMGSHWPFRQPNMDAFELQFAQGHVPLGFELDRALIPTAADDESEEADTMRFADERPEERELGTTNQKLTQTEYIEEFVSHVDIILPALLSSEYLDFDQRCWLGDHFRSAALCEVGVYLAVPHHSKSLRDNCNKRRQNINRMEQQEKEKDLEEASLLMRGRFPNAPIKEPDSHEDMIVEDNKSSNTLSDEDFEKEMETAYCAYKDQGRTAESSAPAEKDLLEPDIQQHEQKPDLKRVVHTNGIHYLHILLVQSQTEMLVLPVSSAAASPHPPAGSCTRKKSLS
ncbi:hypothetical protein BJ165DRAFT_1407130 [Panaeolus papilionaceus]|nr:hypothetical protein BJ165DRAFT_1407130 [Panaeolus papilionaceus]